MTSHHIQGNQNRARIRGIDHFGLTIGSLEQAIHDLKNALGGELCYLEGPITDREPGWMAVKLGARGTCTLRVAAMNVLGTNLELFEYAGAERRSWDTPPGAAGSFFLIFQTPAPERVIARLYNENATVRPLEQPARGYEAVLPSGIHLAIHHAAEQRLVCAVALNRHDFAAAQRELTSTLGFSEKEALSAFGATGLLFAGDQGAPVAVLHGHSPALRPANSDLGGHHVAFHADDVDETIDSFRNISGYVSRGEPETITDGPIAGDRWVYLNSPFGLQLEIINMPDGALPYGKHATAHRTPIAIGALT
jgi:catechol 2,3-dioxygenase-like lactoylglutathione lyase family enzyme